jgi:predicted ester cyclase
MSSEANKAVVRRYIDEVINGGDLSLIDTFFVPAMREKVRAFLTGHDDFPDGREEIQDIVAEGDKVMARWIFRATHQAPFFGIPPTGKKIEITGYGTYYFENGLIAWDTIVFDWLDALEQLGATITPASVPAASAAAP